MVESTNGSAQVPQVPIIFMGTPTLAQELLASLVASGYNIVAVITKPDTKQGRKGGLQASPVKEFALSKNIPVLTPKKIDDDFYQAFKDLKPDLVLVAAYGKILPARILDLPGLGCLNVHYSLLPRFRGASPIQNTLLFGDTETGVTVMKMDTGLDTGDIIGFKKIPVEPTDTTLTLTPKLTQLAQELTLDILPLWIRQKIRSVPQDSTQAVLCQLIERNDGKIEWSQTAEEIYNRFRAFQPWPGIFTFWKRDKGFLRLKLISISLHAEPTAVQYCLGEVFQIGEDVAVQTAKGAIILKMVQLEGKGKTTPQDFLRGNQDFVGSFLV